jgi:hypothetical protein
VCRGEERYVRMAGWIGSGQTVRLLRLKVREVGAICPGMPWREIWLDAGSRQHGRIPRIRAGEGWPNRFIPAVCVSSRERWGDGTSWIRGSSYVSGRRFRKRRSGLSRAELQVQASCSSRGAVLRRDPRIAGASSGMERPQLARFRGPRK